MTPQLAISKLQLRINKVASSDFDNIPSYAAIEALNKSQIDWVRRQINGLNRLQESDEETKMKVDDLQNLLIPSNGKPFILKGKNFSEYFESDPLPTNYLYFKRLIPLASSDCCKNIPMLSIFSEEANIPNYLQDWSFQPSFEWRQTLHTLIGNRVRIYKQKDF